MSQVAPTNAVAAVVAEGTGWLGRETGRRSWIRGRARMQSMPAAGSGRPPGTEFNANLHAALGALAFLVFLFHIGCSGVQGFDVQQELLSRAILASLQFGVELFSSISGYVIVSALQRARTSGDFFFWQMIRILPVLWLTLAMTIPLGLLMQQPQFVALHGRELAWIVPVNLAAVADLLPGLSCTWALGP